MSHFHNIEFVGGIVAQFAIEPRLSEFFDITEREHREYAALSTDLRRDNGRKIVDCGAVIRAHWSELQRARRGPQHFEMDSWKLGAHSHLSDACAHPFSIDSQPGRSSRRYRFFPRGDPNP